MTIQVAILTVSDSRLAGTRKDVSGPELEARCRELGWSVIATDVVPDEELHIAAKLVEWADCEAVDLILTTGGTGIAQRDVTPEATRRVIERELPGVGELMRLKGREQTEFAVLSRAIAGTRKRCFLLNLPGSPTGARFSLDSVQHLVPHVLKLLSGDTEHRDIETHGGGRTSHER
jgi:molybdenum cofactor synthesis domain-containing protein